MIVTIHIVTHILYIQLKKSRHFSLTAFLVALDNKIVMCLGRLSKLKRDYGLVNTLLNQMVNMKNHESPWFKTCIDSTDAINPFLT